MNTKPPIVTKDSIESLAQAAANTLNQRLSEILGPQYVIRATASRFGLNVSSIYLHVHGINPAHNIPENSPVQQKYMMHLCDGFGRPTDHTSVSFEQISASYHLRRNNIKFRKITSTKSITEAVDKLIAWFDKNKSKLDTLLESASV